MKIYKINNVEFWYDRSQRVWWASLKDANGNQIGNAVHAATRDGIKYAIKTLYPIKSEDNS
jgi:hypothetical protein